MREFYTYDYNNNKVVTVFSEEINDLNFHLEDNFNSKFYKSIELSDYDRKIYLNFGYILYEQRRIPRKY